MTVVLRGKLLVLTAFISLATFLSGGAALLATQPSHASGSVRAYQEAHPGQAVPVIVQAEPSADPAALVRGAGGMVRSDLALIHSVAASVPSDSLASLAAAPGVKWVSLDGPVLSLSGGKDNKEVADSDTILSTNVYPQAIHADAVRSAGLYGQGVGVAVVDTGITKSADFDSGSSSRIVATFSGDGSTGDGYGHGSHIAGLIGGNGGKSYGAYAGVAPRVNLINVKVGSGSGAATASDVINGLQFIADNQATYNIRVANLSLRSETPESYATDPLDAAVELLTFRGVLVVVASGNTGTGADAVSYAPANDPFVLTVGALDDRGTIGYSDDLVPWWSSRGRTQDGFAKPDVYAPGRKLISVLSPNSVLATEFRANTVAGNYFQLSGTSMAAGVMSGAAALVFQAHPDWTPGEVRAALINTAAYVPSDASARIVQVDRAVRSAKPVDATLDIKPNLMLLDAAGVQDPVSVQWDRISWARISWSRISWSRISWSRISWSRISWGAASE